MYLLLVNIIFVIKHTITQLLTGLCDFILDAGCLIPDARGWFACQKTIIRK